MTRRHAPHLRQGKTQISRLTCTVLCILTFLPLLQCGAATAAEITPFYTFNQSPLVQIFGLPAAENGWTVPTGKTSLRVVADLTSNFGVDKNGRDEIVLDGETYRTTVVVRYGLNDRLEAGIDIPWVTHSGGFLDDFVSGFHQSFGLSPGGREDAPKNRLLYRYTREGRQRFSIDRPSSGIGDVRLTGALQLYRDDESPKSAVAVRGLIKLPTGESNNLHGSGSTDFALWFSGADSYEVGLGDFGFFAAAGTVLTGKADLLPDIQRSFVGFGSIGIGWSPIDWFATKTQLYAHSPFYRSSGLHELGVTALQWLVGVTFAFTEKTALDIGVSEDFAIISASPDVSFHFALSTIF